MKDLSVPYSTAKYAVGDKKVIIPGMSFHHSIWERFKARVLGEELKPVPFDVIRVTDHVVEVVRSDSMV